MSGSAAGVEDGGAAGSTRVGLEGWVPSARPCVARWPGRSGPIRSPGTVVSGVRAPCRDLAGWVGLQAPCTDPSRPVGSGALFRAAERPADPPARWSASRSDPAGGERAADPLVGPGMPAAPRRCRVSTVGVGGWPRSLRRGRPAWAVAGIASMGWDGGAAAVGSSGESPAALMHGPMMRPTEQGEVGRSVGPPSSRLARCWPSHLASGRGQSGTTQPRSRTARAVRWGAGGDDPGSADNAGRAGPHPEPAPQPGGRGARRQVGFGAGGAPPSTVASRWSHWPSRRSRSRRSSRTSSATCASGSWSGSSARSWSMWVARAASRLGRRGGRSVDCVFGSMG